MMTAECMLSKRPGLRFTVDWFYINQWTLAQLQSALAIGAVGLGFETRVGQIAIFFELSCPGAKLRRWAPPLRHRRLFKASDHLIKVYCI